MEKTLKNIIRISYTMRNCAMLSNYIAIVQPIHSIQKYCYSSAPEGTQTALQNEKFNKSTAKFVSTDLFHALDSLVQKSEINVSSAIFMLYPLSKKPLPCSKDIIYNHKGFNNLCIAINDNAKSLTVRDIIMSIRILLYFEISLDSRLQQTLLQMLRHSINDLSLEEIYFTHTLLEKCPKTPLSEALCIALPIVFQYKYHLELQTDNIEQLSITLRYAIMTSNEKAVHVICKALEEFQWSIDAKSALFIFRSLANVKLTNNIYMILVKVQKNLKKNIGKLNLQQLYDLLKTMKSIIHDERCFVLCNELIEVILNETMANNIDLRSGLLMLNRLNTLDYISIPLLDYLAAKLYENVKNVKHLISSDNITFLEALALADYKPIFWDEICNVIVNESLALYHLKTLTKVAVDLATLDCYSEMLTKKVFEAYSYDVTHPVYTTHEITSNMFLFYQSVKVMQPEYTGPLPTSNVLELCKKNQRFVQKQSPLASTLELALGGPQFVKHNVETKLGHFIDHVIVMKKGGYPVVINSPVKDTETNEDKCSKNVEATVVTNCKKNDILLIEDFELLPDTQTILIFTFPPEAYIINSPRLKGEKALFLRTVEATTGFRTISINQNSWKNLPEAEKIPYLMQAIMLKCDDLS